MFCSAAQFWAHPCISLTLLLVFLQQFPLAQNRSSSSYSTVSLLVLLSGNRKLWVQWRPLILLGKKLCKKSLLLQFLMWLELLYCVADADMIITWIWKENGWRSIRASQNPIPPVVQVFSILSRNLFSTAFNAMKQRIATTLKGAETMIGLIVGLQPWKMLQVFFSQWCCSGLL